jgi:zinc protease
MKKYIFLFACLFMAGVAFSQAVLVETVAAKGDELVIPYKKYLLKNGLTIIIHEDHSDPLVHVDVTYHVGSAREEIGKSGFAHFFEHMMFQGSEHVGDEMHFKYISQAGGTLNGTTNRDRTNYFETLPKNGLELALWLEADRMGFLLDSVTQKKFEIQRSTVKNERGQRYDNVPYGLEGEVTSKNLYTYGHPYSWLTIGYVEDLDRVDVNDLKKFFLRWYGPNNATLTIGGDVSTPAVLALVEKYFSSIKPCPAVKKMAPMTAKLTSDRYISLEDNVRFPMLKVVYPTVPMYHPDEAALDILSHILGGGKSSFLYKNFEKAGKAIATNCNNSTYELSGEFGISIRSFPNASLYGMDSLLSATLAEFEKKGLTDDDIQRTVAYFETSLISGIESVSGKVSRLAFHQTFAGNANMIGEELSAYKKVTREDLLRVYNQYIKGRNRVVLSIIPKGKRELCAYNDNFTIDKNNYKKPADQYDGLKYKKATDNFDRGMKPKTEFVPMIAPVGYWAKNYKSGVRLLGIESKETPMVSLQLAFEGGHLLDSYDTSKNGLAAITAMMLNEATTRHTSEQLSKDLEKLGSSINIYSSGEETIFSVNFLRKNGPQTISILEEKITAPKFDSLDFERIKKQVLENIANQGNQPTIIANKAFNRLVYGENCIKGIPEGGSLRSVKNITLQDVKAFYNKYYSPAHACALYAGDITEQEGMGSLAFLEYWRSTVKYDIPSIRLNNAPQKTKIYMIDKEGAAQSELRVGCQGPPADLLGNYFRCRIANFPLGGNFNSRININLREQHGWTYGARSAFEGTKLAGVFLANAGVRKDATDSSIKELIGEMERYRGAGMTKEEEEFTKNSLLQNEALQNERLSQKMNFLKLASDFTMTGEYAMKKMETIMQINAAEGARSMLTYLALERMYIVVVGDKKTILPGLKKLPYEIVELDKDGNVIQ